MSATSHDEVSMRDLAQSLARLGSWEWDLRSDRVTWSPELIGLVQPCEPPPTTFGEVARFLGPDHERAVRETLAEAIRTGGPMEIDTPLLLGDGRIVHLHSRALVVRDAEGNPVRLVGMSQDVTEQRESEIARRLAQSRDDAVFDQIDDVVFSLDREGRFTTIRGAFERVTGYRPEEWLGRPFTDILDGGSVEQAIRNFSVRLSSREAGRAEYVIRGRDSKITVELSNAPFFVDGVLGGTVGVARDVTSSRLNQEDAERETRLASLGNLAASAAHEFNNVLMSIQPFAELVRRRHGDDERTLNATEQIMTAVRRGRQISQQILRLSRPAKPSLGPVDLSAWIDAFERDVRASGGKRYRLTVTNECDGARVLGDRALIDQVTANLLTNAREAMPEGGTIELRAWRPQPGAVAVSLTDHGAGIPAEHIDHVFDPMFTTRHGSSGLGLTVAHQAMTLQSGTLRVESTVGQGSTFTMIFREARAADADRSADPAQGEPLRVLLVEDEEAIAIGIGMLLESEGMQVQVARRGADVVPAIESFRPHVTVLDVNLPDANGVEVLKEIRLRHGDHPVVFSTGHRDAATLAALHEARLPTISKPFEIAELIEVLRDAVGNGSADSC